ncbi:AbrB/MazE/SpoVT family DNA-binding domain-containing protein [Ramlibacter albus]|uniref:AbrB/MazE/SpoVT family DNA-binding domain-containing protein n=1 Tax=Ramlibacter albus TaxID=2079448 RepID=A0A923MEV8_9BURK|nr:AbrB/MazE/SpoVT family DNA-binding domain-containing protein [Ramlibacter albus]MBC5767732.1 AbrB/MazE/SpoVT family DNA-binding domain-containing protein [Ramlibacter albus]
MEVVTLSPKFQVVIPQPIRSALRLSPGDKMHVIGYGNRVEIIPARAMKSMRGILRESGRPADTQVDRDDDRL